VGLSLLCVGDGCGQAHARLMFQTSAGVTDACMAILIMDSTAPHPLLGKENPADQVRRDKAREGLNGAEMDGSRKDAATD